MVLSLAVLFSAAGCMMIDPATSMNRTHVTKDASGTVTETVEPITWDGDGPDGNYHPERRDDYHHHDSGPHDEYNGPAYAVGIGASTSDGGFERVGFEASAVRSTILHSFITDFQSPDLPGIDWDPYPGASGAGGEINVVLAGDEFIGMVGVGVCDGANTTNSHRENTYYVKETTTTDMFWFHFGGKYKPVPWVYAEGLFGLFFYDLNTEIESNTTTYTYDGLSGFGGFEAIGAGCGLETPWDIMFHLFIGGRLWLALSDEDAYEFGVLQLNGGISCRF